jgi:hypothetical protein
MKMPSGMSLDPTILVDGVKKKTTKSSITSKGSEAYLAIYAMMNGAW